LQAHVLSLENTATDKSRRLKAICWTLCLVPLWVVEIWP